MDYIAVAALVAFAVLIRVVVIAPTRRRGALPRDE